MSEEQRPSDGNNIIVLPYFKGISEQLQRIFYKHGFKVCFKPLRTLRQHLVHVKDRIIDEQKCGTVYSIHCKDCNAEYVGETGRRLNTRIKEHKRSVALADSKSAISDHANSSHHDINWPNVRIIDHESHWSPQKIREAISIVKRKPEINRDSEYHLVPVYGSVLSPFNETGH